GGAVGADEVAAVDLGGADLAVLVHELRIPREDEVLDLLLAAFFLGQVAVLALAAVEQRALEEEAIGDAGCLGELNRLVAIVLGGVPGDVAGGIGAGGVVEVQGPALGRTELDPAIADRALGVVRGDDGVPLRLPGEDVAHDRRRHALLLVG